MFIKFEGIKGEAHDAKHKDEIDVLSWSWGMTQPVSAHVGGGRAAGAVTVQDLNFTKYADRASPVLFQSIAEGKHFKYVVLTVRKAGQHPLEYVLFKLKDAFISSMQTSSSEVTLTETVTVSFEHVEYI
ncbi:MAG: Hcp family type VI secretion system effector, partial [Longimicrobiales bacterium]